jgi:hypothetical protein
MKIKEQYIGHSIYVPILGCNVEIKEENAILLLSLRLNEFFEEEIQEKPKKK